ncbi:MAG: N-acetyltransferase [Gemmatales bacterium]
MSFTQAYLTRHQMCIDLKRPVPLPVLPEGYVWVPWDDRLIDLFAEVHYLSFRKALDAALFKSFANRAGCWHLINEIRRRADFAPWATWLIASPGGCCASIECITIDSDEGNIQNVSVIPAFRRLGLGRALVLQALASFKQMKRSRVSLEVTGENLPAYQLYQRLGFRKISTSFKEITSDDIVY